LQRVESYRELSEGFAQQITDQKAQVENLKTALRQLSGGILRGRGLPYNLTRD